MLEQSVADPSDATQRQRCELDVSERSKKVPELHVFTADQHDDHVAPVEIGKLQSTDIPKPDPSHLQRARVVRSVKSVNSQT